MAIKSIRQAKLHYKHRATGGNAWGSPVKCKTIPGLNVCGVWLEQAGFKVGDRIEITVQDNLLIIKNCTANGNTRD
jgi:toxic protein SymE